MKNLNVKKRIAGDLLKCSPKRVKLNTSNLEEISKAITKDDIRDLIANGNIKKIQIKGISKYHSKKLKEQKRKGRRKGQGSRKGKVTARLPKKEAWMNKIRLQRAFLKELREKGIISVKGYRDLYRKSKGGMFRSKRHLKLYLNENNYVISK